MDKLNSGYAHCRACVLKSLPSDIEVMLWKDLAQVWCRRHDKHVVTFITVDTADQDDVDARKEADGQAN